MKNIYLLFLILFSFTLHLDAQKFNGAGTEADPFQISGIDGLGKISDSTYYWDKHFILKKDIDASVTRSWNIDGADTLGFLPIGSDSDPFTGSFNGNGYDITNVYINRPNESGVALFGYVSGASITNLSLINADITGSTYVGGIVGSGSYSSLFDCFVAGVISGTQSTGGVVGVLSYSEQTNCAVDAEVTGTVIVGGVVGTCNNSEVANSLMTGKVSGSTLAGGIISLNQNSDIYNCYAAGEVSGTNYLGGLIGQNSASTVNNCFFDTTATAQNSAFFSDDNGQTVTGLSSADFSDSTIFINAGWDFNDIWIIDTITTIDTVKRPYLKMLKYAYPVKVDVVVAPQNSVSGASWYNSGDTVRLVAHASSYYKFEGWKLGNGTIITDSLYKFVCTGSFYCSAVFDYNFDGTGTEGDPYQIANYDQLNRLSHIPAIWDKHFILTNNINAGSSRNQNIEGVDTMGFLPVGSSETAFTGTFNGQGYIIDSLFVNRPLEDYIGLFGKADGAMVSNIGLLNTDITGGQYVGGLVGYSGNGTLIEESYVSGEIEGNTYAGGLSGANIHAGVKNCFATATIESSTIAGGLVGQNSTSAAISNCYSAGMVTTGSVIGGLVGENLASSTILNCFYDTLTSNLSSGIGSDDNSQAVTALSTKDFSFDSIFTGSGWDFTYVWETGTDSLLGQNSRPYLKVFGYDYLVSLSVSIAPEDRVSGGGWYNSGDTVVLKAQPSPYYVFKSWQSNGSVLSSNLTYEFICKDDSIITAIFEYDFACGKGTQEDPYQVSTLEHLKTISEVRDLWNAHFILVNDIDASDTRNWNISGSDTLGFGPIGYKYQVGGTRTMFSGTFNGDGHKISGLYINRMDRANVAFFGATGDAKISNLGLIDIDISGSYTVGGIVGYHESSSLDRCMVTGKVNGEKYFAGGIVGYSGYFSTIYNCYSMAAVSCSSYVGGITGDIAGGTYGDSVKMTHCYSGGYVKGDTIVGGLIGRNYKDAGVKNCYFDSQTSNQSVGTGIGTDSVKVLGTTNFTDTSSFDGWDWDSTWQMAYGYDKNKRPCLKWEPVASVVFKKDEKVGTINGDLCQVIIKGCSSDTVTASSNNTRYKFEGWKNETGNIFSTDSILVISPVKSDCVVKAVFKKMIHEVVFSISDDYTAIANAIVSCDTMNYVTDTNGIAKFNLPNGIYSFTIKAQGYVEKIIKVNVFDDDVLLNVELEKLPMPVYIVTFNIRDAQGVISGAIVDFNGQVDTTGSFGQVIIYNVEKGTYGYKVSAEGYKAIEGSVVVADTNVFVDIILELADQGCTVTFNITDGTEGINNALIRFNGNDYTTGSTGQVIIENVENGSYRYTITADGYIGKTDSLTITGRDTTVTIALEKITMLENMATEKIRLFPNPVSESLNIELPGISGEKTIFIYNIVGEVVYRENCINKEHMVINLSNFKQGLYVVQVYNDFGKVFVRKVVKN